MEGSTEANERRHYAPKEAAKGNYMRSVIFVTKHATYWRRRGLHMQRIHRIGILQYMHSFRA